MKKVKKRLKMSKFERLIYTFTFVLLLITPLSIVFSQSTLSKINYEVEKMKKQIVSQEKVNESLSMKIDELASLELIEEIAKEEGLSYNYDNVKPISEGSE